MRKKGTLIRNLGLFGTGRDGMNAKRKAAISSEPTFHCCRLDGETKRASGKERKGRRALRSLCRRKFPGGAHPTMRWLLPKSRAQPSRFYHVLVHRGKAMKYPLIFLFLFLTFYNDVTIILSHVNTAYLQFQFHPPLR